MLGGLRRLAAVFLFCLAASPVVEIRAAEKSDVNIVIALDCSWSVSSVEYALQIKGISRALRDPAVVAAISGGTHGRISLLLTQWATASHQMVVLPWTTITNSIEASAFALRVAQVPRAMIAGGTSLSGALLHANRQLAAAPLEAERDVIDLVTDGDNNNGPKVQPVRDSIIAEGTTINALAITNENENLVDYLVFNIIGGPGAFVEPAVNYRRFAAAFRK